MSICGVCVYVCVRVCVRVGEQACLYSGDVCRKVLLSGTTKILDRKETKVSFAFTIKYVST